MSDAAKALAATYTHQVEIQRTPSDEWTHIHHPDWETSESYPDTMAYAITVRDDHPGAKVRIVETTPGQRDHHIPVP